MVSSCPLSLKKESVASVQGIALQELTFLLLLHGEGLLWDRYCGMENADLQLRVALPLCRCSSRRRP